MEGFWAEFFGGAQDVLVVAFLLLALVGLVVSKLGRGKWVRAGKIAMWAGLGLVLLHMGVHIVEAVRD